MATDVLTFKITYRDCEEIIWRIVEVSSNSMLANLGYLVLASFDTLAYHLFNFTINGKEYCDEETAEEAMYFNINSHKRDVGHYFVKIKDLQLKKNDRFEMLYDFGCDQIFDIELIDVKPMEKYKGGKYPRIIDGQGRGIIDDMSSFELKEIIEKIDNGEPSGIIYDSSADTDWDYKEYNIDLDNCLLKGEISRIQWGYEEGYDEDD